jgi:hypothetical protein
MFFVYALIDPRDLRIRYVGRTERSVPERLGQHIKQTTSGAIGLWLADLRSTGQQPSAVILESGEGIGAECEARWICVLTKCGASLTNASVCGKPLVIGPKLSRAAAALAKIAEGNQASVAKRIGMTQPGLSNLLRRGGEPRSLTAVSIDREYGIPVRWWLEPAEPDVAPVDVQKTG